VKPQERLSRLGPERIETGGYGVIVTAWTTRFTVAAPPTLPMTSSRRSENCELTVNCPEYRPFALVSEVDPGFRTRG